MLEDLKKEISSIKLLGSLLTIAVVIYLLQITWAIFTNFSDIITIAILSWMLSFLMEPIVKRVAKTTHIKLPVATIIVYLILAAIFAGIIYAFVPTIYSQFVQLETVLPKFLVKAPLFVRAASDSITASLNNYLYLIPLGAQFFISFFVILILSFYLIIEKKRINEEIYTILPEKWHEHFAFLQKVTDETFASFFRVQLIFGLLVGIGTYIIMLLFGIDFAAPTAVLAGFFAIIPFIGQVVSFFLPVFIAFLQDPTKALFIVVVIFVMQQIIFNVYGPRLMGKAFKLHPLIIFISFFIGLKVYGPLGGVLAVPVLGIFSLVFHEMNKHYKHHEIKE